ncbi:MAG: DNA-binding protein [Clostridia bacterium]|nr:DNA-binding protein [Clostridia bacterium]
MEKKIELSMLLDLYKGLLTDKQAETMELYYNEDLSLSEIAENMGITRQGVRDALVKAEKILTEAEEKLGLGKRIEALESRLKNINELIKSGGTAKEVLKLSEIGE